MSDRRDYIALEWLSDEVVATVLNCASTIQSRPDAGTDPETLEVLAGQLHQARGSLQMIEFSGAAMLLEEMENTVRRAADRSLLEPEKQALTQAVQQAAEALPGYFAALRRARHELPVPLILILNGLRAAQGDTLLSSGLLFTARLPSSAVDASVSRGDAQELLTKLRQMYQIAYKAYARGESPEKNLGYLQKVCSRAARLIADPAEQLLWQAAAAVLEAHLEQQLPLSELLLRQFLKGLERDITLLCGDGQVPRSRLLDDMVFYAACSDKSPALWQQQGYDAALRDVMSQKLFSQRVRERLIMALRDLSAELDGEQRIPGQGERLAELGDCMAILGLTPHLYTLRAASVAAEQHSASQRLGLSRTLARIADQLSGEDAQPTLQLPLSDERRSVITEVREVLAEVQEALMSYVAEQWRTDHLQPLPDKLAETVETLRSAGLDEPAALLVQATSYISERLLTGEVTPDWAQLDALADAVTSVDYYLERSAEGGRSEDLSLLQVAADCVARLGYPLQGASAENIVQLPSRDKAEPPVDSAPVDDIPLAPKPAIDSPVIDSLDPDVLDIFLEEAREVQQHLDEVLPRLADELHADALLAEVRRAYHTLKGSGRMAGAVQFGEFAWAIENMLNKVVEGHFTMDAARLAVVEAANAELPTLIDALSQSQPVADDALLGIVAQAEALSREQTPNTAPLVSPEQNELTAVFIGEAEVHLKQVEQFLDGVYSYPVALSDELQRALHTLKGSSKMAEVWPVAKLITPLEGLVKEARSMRVLADESLVTLIRDVLAATRKMVLRLRHQSPSSLDVPEELQSRVEQAMNDMLARAESSNTVQSGELAPGVLTQFLMTYGDHLQHLADRLHDIGGVNAALFADFAPTMGQFAQRAEDIGSESTAEMAQALQVLFSHVSDPVSPDYLALVERATDQLMEDLNQIAAEQSAGENTDLLEALRDFESSLRSDNSDPAPIAEEPVEGELQVSEPAAAEPEPVMDVEVPDALPQLEEDDVDPEILAIFLEEARDLLDGLDTALQNWNEDVGNTVYLDDILRFLHTFKGGARLTGLSQLGDLSHEMETDISEALAAREPDLPALLKRVQRAQDTLVSTMDALGGDELPMETVADTDTLPAPFADYSQPAATQQDVARPLGPRAPQEMIKVPSELLERLINLAGETSIARGRLGEQVNDVHFSLDEMEMTVERLQEQVRRLDMETEAQIIHRQEQMESEGAEGFDPLEFDRYSQLQQLSRALLESASDLVDLRNTVLDKSRDMETLLIQQSRVNTELQEGLMRSQMVHFARMVPRLRRGVRQLCGELGKDVDFKVYNAEGEMDRRVLERIIPALEHMLRNAIDHGIEAGDQRLAAGKAAQGEVSMRFSRQGGDVVITISDDGAGIDLEAVRKKAERLGLVDADTSLSERQLLDFIFHAGFSTADNITQISGRGVGMDVVHSEIKQLGGSIEVSTERGVGSRFEIRLPFTVSVNRALMVSVGGEVYAVPLNNIEGIVRVSPYELEVYYEDGGPDFEYAGRQYNLRYMGQLLGVQSPHLDGQLEPRPVLLIRNAEPPTAVQVDSLMGSQEVVVKTLGPQFAAVPGLSGATVLGDGSVVVILDMLASIRAEAARRMLNIADPMALAPADHLVKHVMVVDDSVTVRKVTSRLLERQQMKVTLARDGMEALSQLQEMEPLPDVMLLDIEMPRMDGFEVAGHMQSNPRLQNIPIIMISSRTGQKHRQRAAGLGVDCFLGKPYQEIQLLKAIDDVLSKVEIE